MKQVSREPGSLPSALATEHRPSARPTKHATTDPVPSWEQYFQCVRQRHWHRRTARFGPVEPRLGVGPSRREEELGKPCGTVRPD
jgi:hypothetical protein